jgi:crotonobetainyl-CoA:carnitine CoA-transferase CaiB-like acyl-CoA transferase
VTETETRPPGSVAPLTGVRVMEIGAFMAAPFATMQLADLGADVVKVEQPGSGDPVRQIGPYLTGHSSPFARLNRNKRSIALDLKAEQGKGVLRRLLTTADVLVENLRPGALSRLGFDYETVRAVNPRIIYVSASGWGQDGPLAGLPGLDIMAQARSGLMSITGTPDGDPVKVGVPICDLVCGMYVALGVLGALRARELTGDGQYVDVSLFESGVSFAIWEAGRYFATGEAGKPLGSAHQSTAPYQAIRTADGWVTLGAVTPATWAGLCGALGLTDLYEDPRYQDAHQRHGHRDTLIPAIEAVTSRRTTEELLAALEAARVPCAPIADTAQVFNDPHLNRRDFFWDSAHPAMGEVRQLGSPMRFSATPTVRAAAGPLLGADTVALLTESGFDPAVIDELIDAEVVAVPQDSPRPAADVRDTTPGDPAGPRPGSPRR